jgi:hypothetical protein
MKTLQSLTETGLIVRMKIGCHEFGQGQTNTTSNLKKCWYLGTNFIVSYKSSNTFSDRRLLRGHGLMVRIVI